MKAREGGSGLGIWERSWTCRVLAWVFSWQGMRWLALSGASVATLVGLFYAVENWRGGRAWENYRSAAEGRGEALRLDQLAPSPVPDAQNLAAAPYFKPLFDWFRDSGQVAWRDTNGLNRLTGVSRELRMAGSDGRVRAGALLEEVPADLAACAAFYRGNTNYPQAPGQAPPAEVVRVALSRYDAAFDELRVAAADRPAFRFPVEYEEGLPFLILLPHLAIVKGHVSVLELRAIAALDQGRKAEALADLDLGLRLSGGLSEEPLLISHLVRLATLNMSLQVIREGLTRHLWTEAELEHLASALDGIDLLREAQRGLVGERACLLGAIDWIRQHRRDGVSNLGYGDSDYGWAPLAAALIEWMPGGWLRQDMVRGATLYDEHVLRVLDPAQGRAFPERSRAMEGALQAVPLRPWTICTRALFPSLGRAALKSARMQAALDAARIGIALERFRLAHGGLPAQLNELGPELIAEQPQDLVGGGPLRYRALADGGYLLYAVGWNGTDDGGTRAWGRSKDRREDSEQGDWVWTMPGRESAARPAGAVAWTRTSSERRTQ